MWLIVAVMVVVGLGYGDVWVVRPAMAGFVVGAGVVTWGVVNGW